MNLHTEEGATRKANCSKYNFAKVNFVQDLLYGFQYHLTKLLAVYIYIHFCVYFTYYISSNTIF